MIFLFDWIKSWFVRRPVVRDVAGLSAAAVGADAKVHQEVVDTSKQPWKPTNRRLALRDPRLLPKPKRSPGILGWNKRPKVMGRDEANRMFAETLRTQRRDLRDLIADVDQLSRYGLPIWKSEEDIARALGISVGLLRHFSIHRARDSVSHYVTFAIRKRSGGCRLIHAPKRRLKSLQRILHDQLVSKLPTSPYAHGFREGRSVATNAAPHVGKSVVVKLDVANCFPSIHLGRVRGLLIAYGYSYPVAQILAVLMTEAPRQIVEVEGKLYHVPVGSRVCVQGAPTSPGLCNAVLRRLDVRLAGLARKHGFDYTRYADDLTFSGNDAAKVKLLITIAGRIAKEEGLPLNTRKTRVMRKGQRQAVTGVTVNQTMGLSRRERRRLRAALHQQKAECRTQVEGKLAYLRMLNPAQADALLRSDRRRQPPA